MFDQIQIDELKKISPDLSIAEEGGYSFIRIANLKLPDNCTPNLVEALLCPTPREGYLSRLFVSAQIACGRPALNWNGNIRVLGKNWHAVSWKVPGNLRLYEILLVHLKAFRK